MATSVFLAVSESWIFNQLWTKDCAIKSWNLSGEPGVNSRRSPSLFSSACCFFTNLFTHTHCNVQSKQKNWKLQLNSFWIRFVVSWCGPCFAFPTPLIPHKLLSGDSSVVGTTTLLSGSMASNLLSRHCVDLSLWMNSWMELKHVNLHLGAIHDQSEICVPACMHPNCSVEISIQTTHTHTFHIEHFQFQEFCNFHEFHIISEFCLNSSIPANSSLDRSDLRRFELCVTRQPDLIRVYREFSLTNLFRNIRTFLKPNKLNSVETARSWSLHVNFQNGVTRSPRQVSAETTDSWQSVNIWYFQRKAR